MDFNLSTEAFPDFTPYGYRVVRSLGRGSLSGRATYLATRTVDPAQQVVVKFLQLASSTAKWSGFQALQRESQVLQQLDHPGIPKYLDSFETATGFALVQEYKQAPSLAEKRTWSAAQVKQMAIALLEILAYLQRRIPPIIHRDIKPENILVDGVDGTSEENQAENLQVYLVDFGLATLGSGEQNSSSVTGGTFGFMAPEQIYDRPLTTATDLYGLGVTAICLLAGIPSEDVGTLFDYQTNRLAFRDLLPQVGAGWLDWLERMVHPDPQQRFADAAMALLVLEPLAVLRVPVVSPSVSRLELKATYLGETLKAKITASNEVPDTLLSGTWKLAPHPSDRQVWISCLPATFVGNQRTVEIAIDTSQLMAGKTYQRELLLESNGSPKVCRVPLSVTAAPLPVAVPQLPYHRALQWFGFGAGGVFLTSLSWAIAPDTGAIGWASVMAGIAYGAWMREVKQQDESVSALDTIFLTLPGAAIATLIALVGAIAGYAILHLPGAIILGTCGGLFGGHVAENAGFWETPTTGQGRTIGAIAGGLTGLAIAAGGGVPLQRLEALLILGLLLWVAGTAVGVAIGVLGNALVRSARTELMSLGFRPPVAWGMPLLTVGFAAVLGMWLSAQIFLGKQVATLWTVATAATGLPLGLLLLYPYVWRVVAIARYRRSESNLLQS